MSRLRNELQELDWHVLLLVFVLVGLGALFLNSATKQGVEFADQVTRHLLFILPATAVLAGFLLIPYTHFQRWAPWIYGVCLVLLICIYLPGLGRSINGARRWLSLGLTSVQPSEFMKLGLILQLAYYLRPRTDPNHWQGFVVPGLFTVLPMALIIFEPDLSSALVLLPIMFCVCFTAGIRLRFLLLVLLVGLVCFFVLYEAGGLREYQMDRIDAWLDQDQMDQLDKRDLRLGAGYHLWQSLIAVGSGGFDGMGYQQGLQNIYDFLPYRTTDFIFSVIAEETGFVGSVFFLFLYGLLIFTLLGIAARTRERYGRLLVTGIAVLFATQLFMHVAVCTGIMPPTGLTLPLISAGRSSLLTSFAAIGLALNVGMRRVRVVSPDAY